MKKLIPLSVLISFFCSSCLTLGKYPIVLVDAPKNATVNCNGKEVSVEDVKALAYTKSERPTTGVDKGKRVDHTTYYMYPGVKVKMKKKMSIDVKSGDKKGVVKIKTKPAIGMLIVETIFTLGIGTIIDLATGHCWTVSTKESKFIDVPAVLNNKTPRTQKELADKVKADFKLK